MPNTFFIGDTHFGHKNIIVFYPSPIRPGSSIQEHDEILIQRWNSVVKQEDTVWHLGDFGICGSDRIVRVAQRLLGNKKIVLGNHDKAHNLWAYFKLYGVAYFEGRILSHIPVHESQLGKRFSENIHGHTHLHNMKDTRYWNVSCEQINCTPIAWEELKRKYG